MLILSSSIALLFNVYPVRSPILRHSARTNSAAVHARMEPGTAQAADNRPGRKGQLWATTKAEEGTCPSRLNWFDVPDAMMQKQQCWPFGFRESLSRCSWIPKESKPNLRGDKRIWSEESRRGRINKYFICFLGPFSSSPSARTQIPLLLFAVHSDDINDARAFPNLFSKCLWIYTRRRRSSKSDGIVWISLTYCHHCLPTSPSFHEFILQEIRKGLLKAAKTTGAWVFTGGTNTGMCHGYPFNWSTWGGGRSWGLIYWKIFETCIDGWSCQIHTLPIKSTEVDGGIPVVASIPVSDH